ncbi:MAG: hypothetical protein K2X32_15100 [Phycisphaerales bacterium]|nr:hypothetical protein [Phycisphaerales bacterium]
MARTSALAKLSIAEINSEIRRRQRGVGKLMKKRATLVSRLAKIDAEIVAAGGSVRGGGMTKAGGTRKRPKNEMSLVESLHAVLKGKTMSVTDVSEAVQKAGYMTTSPSFRTIVNQALLANRSKFKKVSRGQYTSV